LNLSGANALARCSEVGRAESSERFPLKKIVKWESWDPKVK